MSPPAPRRTTSLGWCGSIGDVVKARIEEMELETNLLRDLYIARS
jgi:hypothetical protein